MTRSNCCACIAEQAEDPADEEADDRAADGAVERRLGSRQTAGDVLGEVETRIGRALLSGQIVDGAIITLDVEAERLVVLWRNPGEDVADAHSLETAAA